MIRRIFIILFTLSFTQSNLLAKTEYLQKGIDLYNRKNLKQLNSNLNKILFLIQKVNYPIYTFQEYSINKKKDFGRTKFKNSYVA